MKRRALCILGFVVLFFLMTLSTASAADIQIPDFAFYAGKQIVKIEKHEGFNVYFLPEDTSSKVLGAYAALLNDDYGFRDIRSEKRDGIGYIWFADHELESPEVFIDVGFEGTCSFMFATAGAGDGLQQVILLPGKGFAMMDTGERYEDLPKPGIQCDQCEGTGKCQKCGGDMWFEGYKWVWKGPSGFENEYVTELCDDENCHAGSCKACGGDGKI